MEELYNRFAKPVIDNIPVAELGNSHIIKILASVESDTSRSKLKSVLSIFIQWLVQQSLIDPDRLNINWRVINGMLPKTTQASRNYPRVAIADWSEGGEKAFIEEMSKASGISAAEFAKERQSKPVQQLRQFWRDTSYDIARMQGIPAFVVNGKYLILNKSLRSAKDLNVLVKELNALP